MKKQLEKEHINGFVIHSYVSIDTMQETFIPPIKNRVQPIEKDWEACWCINQKAKMHSRNYWMVPKKNEEIELRVADSMTVYNIILQNHDFSQIMEDTLLIGTILQMMRSPNPNVFTYTKTEFLGYTKEERNYMVERIRQNKRYTEKEITHYIKELNQPKYNKERIYHYDSWDDQFQSTKKRTFSMIIDPTHDPITGKHIEKVEDNSFLGIVHRTFKYTHQLQACTIEERLHRILLNPSHYTRSIWDTAPKTGQRGTRPITPGPILAKIQQPNGILFNPNFLKTIVQKQAQPVQPSFPPQQPLSMKLAERIKRMKLNVQSARKETARKLRKSHSKTVKSQWKKGISQWKKRKSQWKRGGQRIETQKHNKIYMFPRRFSKTYCKKRACNKMGFTEKASCRPYKNCYRLFKKKSAKNSK
jgi:hypothetical protein